MDAAVVYESAWGNTRAVAEAVAAGMSGRAHVELFDVEHAPAPHELAVDLLVVGGPTHALGMSRPSTRQDAADRGGHALQRGIREWLEGTEPLDVRAAAFDTHVRHPNLPGHAGRKAAKVLRRRGADLIAAPESFYVRDAEGPLLDGELERARTWGAELAGLLPQHSYTA